MVFVSPVTNRRTSEIRHSSTLLALMGIRTPNQNGHRPFVCTSFIWYIFLFRTFDLCLTRVDIRIQETSEFNKRRVRGLNMIFSLSNIRNQAKGRDMHQPKINFHPYPYIPLISAWYPYMISTTQPSLNHHFSALNRHFSPFFTSIFLVTHHHLHPTLWSRQMMPLPWWPLRMPSSWPDEAVSCCHGEYPLVNWEMAMGNGWKWPIVIVDWPIENGDFPWLCYFTRG